MSFDRNPTPPITAQDTQNGNPKPPTTLPERWARKIPEGYVVSLSGGFAGAVSGFVSCPLDVIKTKLQAQGGFQTSKEGVKIATAAYRGVQGTAATIWKEEGLRGMYRGLGPMLLGYVPTWAVYMTVYHRAQTYFKSKTDVEFLVNTYAALSGGACSTMTTNPIWVIKTRLMSQSSSRIASRHSKPPWHYKNTWDAARMMYRNEGILSFYSGLTPALLGLTHVAIQFPLYEVFKKKFTGLGGEEKETEELRNHHFYRLTLAVFLSKLCASTVTYPHEVVRTRLQTQQRSSNANSSSEMPLGEALKKSGDRGPLPEIITPASSTLRYRGTMQTCKAILMEEGWRGFYAGLGTNLIRAVPSAMTTILTYEFLKKTIFELQRGDHQ